MAAVAQIQRHPAAAALAPAPHPLGLVPVPSAAAAPAGPGAARVRAWRHLSFSFLRPPGPAPFGRLRSPPRQVLLDAAEDVTAFRHFPTNHWQKVWSTNSLERLNAEIKRRTNVVGIFPNDAAALRLITVVCVETHDEWSVSERRYLSQESMDQLKSDALAPAVVALAKVR